MSDVRLSVGTRVYAFAGQPPTYDIAGFNGLAWTEIGEVTDLGEFGGTAQITEFTPLATGVIKKLKGSINYGTAALSIGRLSGDAGQALLKDGFDGTNAYVSHAFRVVSEDGQIAYFTGMISSFVTATGEANTVTAVSSNIELDNRVIAGQADFTLRYLSGANGTVIGNVFQSVASGDDGAPVYAVAAAGYVFDEWSDTTNDNPRIDDNVTGNITVTASFVPE